jgi:hypothetical protein
MSWLLAKDPYMKSRSSVLVGMRTSESLDGKERIAMLGYREMNQSSSCRTRSCKLGTAAAWPVLFVEGRLTSGRPSERSKAKKARIGDNYIEQGVQVVTVYWNMTCRISSPLLLVSHNVLSLTWARKRHIAIMLALWLSARHPSHHAISCAKYGLFA